MDAPEHDKNDAIPEDLPSDFTGLSSFTLEYEWNTTEHGNKISLFGTILRYIVSLALTIAMIVLPFNSPLPSRTDAEISEEPVVMSQEGMTRREPEEEIESKAEEVDEMEAMTAAEEEEKKKREASQIPPDNKQVKAQFTTFPFRLFESH